MSEVKKNIGPWKQVKGITRREEVVLNRLRAGHSRLTHGYLMDSVRPQVPPICRYCSNAVLTVKHLILTFPNLDRERRKLTVFLSAKAVT